MRSPNRHRPLRRKISRPPIDKRLTDIAAKASYRGSTEHKDTPSFAGKMPRPRIDASICERRFASDLKAVNQWLENAISRGAISQLFEGDFPRYVWYKDGDTVYEARLINSELGEYKGYPLNSNEIVDGLELIYG